MINSFKISKHFYQIVSIMLSKLFNGVIVLQKSIPKDSAASGLYNNPFYLEGNIHPHISKWRLWKSLLYVGAYAFGVFTHAILKSIIFGCIYHVRKRTRFQILSNISFCSVRGLRVKYSFLQIK